MRTKLSIEQQQQLSPSPKLKSPNESLSKIKYLQTRSKKKNIKAKDETLNTSINILIFPT
jgi:hypothetical protein